MTLAELVDRMRRARNSTTKTYMPAALLAICDLAEQGKIRDGIVKRDDYRIAYKRLLLEAAPELEDTWFRPLLHVHKHGMWVPMLAEREVALEPRTVSRMSESKAAKAADAVRLSQVLAAALLHRSQRDRLRELVYQVLADDREARSEQLASVHIHLQANREDTHLLDELLHYEQQRLEPLPLVDERRWQEARRVVRSGQPAFRSQLLAAYANRCSISRADAVLALEAAHIIPFLGERSNRVQNGLLLRADLHTLFDLGLITIGTSNGLVVNVGVQLQRTVYEELDGQPLALPAKPEDQPDPAALDWHRRKNSA